MDRLKERLETARKGPLELWGGAAVANGYSQEPREPRIGFSLVGHQSLFSIRSSE